MIFSNKQIDISPFRHLYPFESRYLDLNGLKYHYLDEGRGDPVVMIHGNPTWSFYFRELIKRLSPRYRAVVPDHIGCGLSDKPGTHRYDYRLKSRVDDLEQLIDHLGIGKRISLVVHDWGGMIGMAYAVRFPERVTRIVVMNTAAFLPPEGKPIPLRLRLVRNVKPFATLAVLGLNLFALGALFMAPRKRLAGDVRKGLIAPYNCWANRIATLKFVQDIPVCQKDPSYGLVKHVDENLHVLRHLPVLICWGERDFVFDMDYLSEWRRRFPEAQVNSFPDTGHYVLEDAPDRALPLIVNFFDKHPI